MYGISDTVFYTVFRGTGTNNQVVSLYTYGSPNSEKLIGLSGQSNSVIIRAVDHATDFYTLVMILNRKLYAYYEHTTPASSAAHELDTVIFSENLNLQASDPSALGGTSFWVVVGQGDANLNGYHINAAAPPVTAATASFTTTAKGTVTALRITYVSATELYIFAMQTTIGSVIRISGVGGTYDVDHLEVSGLTDTWFLGWGSATLFVFGSNDVGLYNTSLTGVQTILWKAAITTSNFDFSTHN